MLRYNGCYPANPGQQPKTTSAYGEAYELPNAIALYGESCAAIGNMMWNWRMLAANGGAKHADIIERALYNGINSGMSLDGTLYSVIGIRWPSILLASDQDSQPMGMTSTCCPPISNAPSPLFRDISTAPAATAFT